jgi:hypothetical protein
VIADRRLYLDRSQSRLVEESDTACAWLLAGKGQEIAPEAVKRLRLETVDGRVKQRSLAEGWVPLVQEQTEVQESAAVVQTPRPTRRYRRRPGEMPGTPAPEE